MVCKTRSVDSRHATRSYLVRWIFAGSSHSPRVREQSSRRRECRRETRIIHAPGINFRLLRVRRKRNDEAAINLRASHFNGVFNKVSGRCARGKSAPPRKARSETLVSSSFDVSTHTHTHTRAYIHAHTRAHRLESNLAWKSRRVYRRWTRSS